MRLRRLAAVATGLALLGGIATSQEAQGQSTPGSYSLTTTACQAGWVQEGQACWDQQVGASTPAQWTVSQSSATWIAPTWKVTYTFSMPATVTASGGTVSLSVTAQDISNNSGIDERICVFQASTTFEIKEGGDQCATAYAQTPGSSVTKSKTLTLVPGQLSESQATASISLGDGGNLYYTYQAAATATTTTTQASTTTAPSSIATPAAQSGAVVGTLGSLQGDVSVRHPGGNFVDATNGEQLQEGDDISTGADSSATITFPDGTVSVQPLTQINLGSLLRQRANVSVRVNLRIGAIAAKTNKSQTPDSDYSVRTPTSVSSVRGSAMTVSYDPKTHVTTVAVQEDAAVVQPIQYAEPPSTRPWPPETATGSARTVHQGAVLRVGTAGVIGGKSSSSFPVIGYVLIAVAAVLAVGAGVWLRRRRNMQSSPN